MNSIQTPIKEKSNRELRAGTSLRTAAARSLERATPKKNAQKRINDATFGAASSLSPGKRLAADNSFDVRSEFSEHVNKEYDKYFYKHGAHKNDSPGVTKAMRNHD